MGVERDSRWLSVYTALLFETYFSDKKFDSAEALIDEMDAFSERMKIPPEVADGLPELTRLAARQIRQAAWQAHDKATRPRDELGVIDPVRGRPRRIH